MTLLAGNNFLRRLSVCLYSFYETISYVFAYFYDCGQLSVYLSKDLL
jgi:hypothetical protein